MNINKIIKEEIENIIKENFNYEVFDVNNQYRDDIEIHLKNTLTLLINMGSKFIETYDNNILDFKLVLNTKEVIEDITNNINQIIDNNERLFENDDLLDDLQFKIKDLLDSFNSAFDKLETLINFDIEDIYNDFKNEFAKYY
jgi:hypothetical protein